MEMLAWNLTRLWMGSYYRTYPISVQKEVEGALKDAKDFIRGPMSFSRDTVENIDLGFVVKEGNYLSARWPGDAHRFGQEFLKMLE
jgi:protease I